MTDKLDTSREAVEQAATDLELAVTRRSFRDNDGVQEARTRILRALVAERDRLAAEVASLRAYICEMPPREGAEPIGCPTPGACSAIDTYVCGQAEMRERAAKEVEASAALVDHPSVFMGGPSHNARRLAGSFATAIRALPLEQKEPKE